MRRRSNHIAIRRNTAPAKFASLILVELPLVFFCCHRSPPFLKVHTLGPKMGNRMCKIAGHASRESRTFLHSQPMSLFLRSEDHSPKLAQVTKRHRCGQGFVWFGRYGATRTSRNPHRNPLPQTRRGRGLHVQVRAAECAAFDLDRSCRDATTLVCWLRR